MSENECVKSVDSAHFIYKEFYDLVVSSNQSRCSQCLCMIWNNFLTGRKTSSQWYNIYNPVISVELTEVADLVVGNNDALEGIQLDLTV